MLWRSQIWRCGRRSILLIGLAFRLLSPVPSDAAESTETSRFVILVAGAEAFIPKLREC